MPWPPGSARVLRPSARFKPRSRLRPLLGVFAGILCVTIKNSNGMPRTIRVPRSEYGECTRRASKDFLREFAHSVRAALPTSSDLNELQQEPTRALELAKLANKGAVAKPMGGQGRMKSSYRP
eukprot:CAMPEP_0171559546 /NCGR_PEP_ID=MMETSP0960-20121227/12902_1 /TAXON_ID=87120 /ORGANISM="Aurantiochytrium limacinum, Strain ATCCMYA-1381" /LENGTH=122 /DNA_ID=CAMNT_0012111049 /DNA_START=250 /DNA_END=614 /DNA_ORIENTATION=-